MKHNPLNTDSIGTPSSSSYVDMFVCKLNTADVIL